MDECKSLPRQRGPAAPAPWPATRASRHFPHCLLTRDQGLTPFPSLFAHMRPAPHATSLTVCSYATRASRHFPDCLLICTSVLVHARRRASACSLAFSSLALHQSPWQLNLSVFEASVGCLVCQRYSVGLPPEIPYCYGRWRRAEKGRIVRGPAWSHGVTFVPVGSLT